MIRGFAAAGSRRRDAATPPPPDVQVGSADVAWMVIGADTTSELATAKANGATHALVSARWSTMQSTVGGAVNAAAVLTNISDALAADLKVCLRVSLQYTPTFVETGVPKFRRKNADGTFTEFSDTGASGNNVRDWVWSATGRTYVQDFATKLFTQLDWSDIDRVQLGGGPAGELKYPNSDTASSPDVPYWWGFSDPAQTGTGLATGQTVCPVPGHRPSDGTTWTANDASFVTWYTQSMTNWMLWWIARHREYWTGPIWVLHPGAGLRPNRQTPTSASQGVNYRVNVAQGTDWDHQMAAYPDDDIWPHCTWADPDHFAGNPFSDNFDGDAAPWYHLLRVARNRGRTARIWGENTGNQSNTDMDRVFASGAVAHGYQGFAWLSHDLLADGTGDTYSNWDARIITANKAYGDYRRGVNMAGGEFAPSASTLPGTYGTDYSYDTAAAFTTVGGRGHKIVRVPFRWERIQPTRNAALNSAELTRLQQVVADAQTAGMRVVLDCHNYGRYINSAANGGAELVLNNTLPIADLVDLWTRLSTAFKTNAGVYAYGLMNEPHDFTATTGSFSGTVRYNWASGVQGWTGDTATASNVSGQLRLTASLGSGSVNMRKDDAATVSGGSTPTGAVLRVKATPVALPTGTWTAKSQWQNSSFAWQNPTSTTLTRVDTGATVSSLTVGQAVYVTSTFSSITSPPNAFALQVDGSGATAGTVTVDFDDFSQGSLTGNLTAAQVWESASQQVVTAIRNNTDTTKILVAGYNWSGAKVWATTHSAPWITDSANNHAYEAHYYFDVDNSGDYPASYATENTAAVTAGYASLSGRVVAELQNWTTWLVKHGVRGFVGEIGWPNTADTTLWNAVGETLYDELDRHTVDVAYWAAGARWGTGYNLSLYTGATQTTIKAQALIVEAHPGIDTGAPPPPPSPSGQSAVTLIAADGETISGTTQSNFLGNGYYTRKGFTRAANWTGPSPLGGSFAGWDDPNFIPIGTFLTDFDPGDTGFYARMNDLGLNTMLPCAGSVSLTNNVTFGKTAVVTIEATAGGTITNAQDPGVVGVSSGEEPGDVAAYNDHNSQRAAWLSSSDGPGRFGFYNYDHSLINGELEFVIFPAQMMLAADFITADIYWFAGAPDSASVPLKLHQSLYPTAPQTGLPGQGTQTQCARGSHYGSMMDSMRKHLNSSTTRPCLVWIENSAPYDDSASAAITPAQLKWAVWATLVHGARGIAYFNHTFRPGFSSHPTSNNNFNNNAYGGPTVAGNGMYAAVKETNLRALQIAPVLNAPRDGYFVYGDLATSGSIATAGFLTAVTSTNARSRLAGVDACCKWVPTTRKHWILATTREPETATNVPVTFRMVDQGQTVAVPAFGGSNITITRGGSIPAGFCEFADTFATAATYKCYRID